MYHYHYYYYQLMTNWPLQINVFETKQPKPCVVPPCLLFSAIGNWGVQHKIPSTNHGRDALSSLQSELAHTDRGRSSEQETAILTEHTDKKCIDGPLKHIHIGHLNIYIYIEQSLLTKKTHNKYIYQNKETIYLCRYSKNVHRHKSQALTIVGYPIAFVQKI